MSREINPRRVQTHMFLQDRRRSDLWNLRRIGGQSGNPKKLGHTDVDVWLASAGSAPDRWNLSRIPYNADAVKDAVDAAASSSPVRDFLLRLRLLPQIIATTRFLEGKILPLSRFGLPFGRPR